MRTRARTCCGDGASNRGRGGNGGANDGGSTRSTVRRRQVRGAARVVRGLRPLRSGGWARHVSHRLRRYARGHVHAVRPWPLCAALCLLGLLGWIPRGLRAVLLLCCGASEGALRRRIGRHMRALRTGAIQGDAWPLCHGV